MKEGESGERSGLDLDALIEPILGAPRVFTSREIATAAGIPVHRARRFWRALGLANVADDEPELTSVDGEALELLLRLIDDGIFTEAQALHLARILGRAGARVARSYCETVLDPLVMSALSGGTDTGQLAPVIDRSISDLQAFLVYTWRRHAAAGLNQLAPTSGNRFTTVGFADLVEFTRMSIQLSDHELTELVSRFEERSGDVITAHGGKLIKSLGDEVLFIADEPAAAANIALQIVHNVSKRRLPGIRIGLEYGPVITHGGDVFGHTVNLASRLTMLAEPNHVLIGPQLAEALTGLATFDVQTVESVHVRGVGLIVPALLERTENPYDPKNVRRGS